MPVPVDAHHYGSLIFTPLLSLEYIYAHEKTMRCVCVPQFVRKQKHLHSSAFGRSVVCAPQPPLEAPKNCSTLCHSVRLRVKYITHNILLTF